MKLKPRPFLICIFVTFFIQISLILLTELPVIAAASAKEPIQFSFVVINSLSSILALLSPVVVGALYPILNKKDTLTLQRGISGGAISVIVASFLSALFLMCFRWRVLPQIVHLINPKISTETMMWLFDAMGGIGYLLIGGNSLNEFLPAGIIWFGIMGAIGGAAGTILVTKQQFRRKALS